MEISKKTFTEMVNEINLINSKLIEIKIYLEIDILNIDLSFLIEKKVVKFRFIDIIEYEFYHNSKYIFYNVEDYKLLLTEENNIYLSLDPNFETIDMSFEDKDFILAKDFQQLGNVSDVLI